jgi:hypothetical protein
VIALIASAVMPKSASGHANFSGLSDGEQAPQKL